MNSEELVTDTTPVHTIPPTETTHSTTVDSTSDSLSDIYPHLTESFTTTTSTAAPEEYTEPCLTAAPQEDENSHEDDKEDLTSSSTEHVCEGELSQADMQTFDNAMNAFSKDLLKQVYLESHSPNVVVSPFSIALGLLQLTLGNDCASPYRSHMVKVLQVTSTKLFV